MRCPAALCHAGYALGRRQSKLAQALRRVTPGRRAKSGSIGSGQLGSPVGSASQRPSGAAANGALAAAAVPGRGSPGGKPSSLSGEDDGPEAPLAVPLHPPPAGSGAANGRSAAALLPPSPFDAAEPGAAPAPAASSQLPGAAPSGQATVQLPGRGRLLLYQHSMLRLRSSVAGFRGRGGASSPPRDALGTLEEGQAASAEDGAAAAAGGAAGGAAAAEGGSEQPEPELNLEPAGAPRGKLGAAPGAAPACSSRGASPAKGEWRGSALRVTSRFQPLLTPSGCAGNAKLALHPPLSPQAAADIYAGAWLAWSAAAGSGRCDAWLTLHVVAGHSQPPHPDCCLYPTPSSAGRLEPVAFDTLREAQAVSKFAVAAYGLQSVIWAKGK